MLLLEYGISNIASFFFLLLSYHQEDWHFLLFSSKSNSRARPYGAREVFFFVTLQEGVEWAMIDVALYTNLYEVWLVVIYIYILYYY